MDQRLVEALRRYTCDLYAPEDEFLRSIRTGSAELGIPQVHIRPDEARILQVLLVAIGARRVVELGTLAGYSGVWIMRALPEDGRLITLERNPDHAAFARATFEKAGFGDRVEIREGDALALLPQLTGPFDAVFIDTAKAAYPDFLNWAAAALRSGGLIAAHNAFLRGAILDPEQQHIKRVAGVQTFNRQLAGDPRWMGTIIPVGDGLAVGIKR